MKSLHPTLIHGWHAHVYFDACTRDAAWALRGIVGTELAGQVQIGRFNEGPVGPHPLGSYELAFSPASFSQVVSWLTLNHGSLDVLVHPNTDDELRDHRDCALWLGRSHTLELTGLAP